MLVARKSQLQDTQRYVNRTLLPNSMESAIGKDIEHFRSVEEFLSSNDTHEDIEELLNHEEQQFYNMVTD